MEKEAFVANEVSRPRVSLRDLLAVFLKLGFTAFGGPAAHIAMMEDEVVARRNWMGRQQFLDLVGATNLIPGPNSTEMVIHVGYLLRSWPGMLISGCSFILPAAVMTGVLAGLYVRWGEVPQVGALLFGVKPAVIVIIAAALTRLGRKATKSVDLALLGVGVLLLSLLGSDPVLLILGAGLAGMLWLRMRGSGLAAGLVLPAFWLGASGSNSPPGMSQLFLYFLKIGSVLFGSGYVLIAYLEQGLVAELGWITDRQLLDAVAIGQFTPGPVLTAATFVGYLTHGPAGAALATLAIFLPSFFFVVLLRPWVPRMRRNRWTGAFLDSVNVAAVALMLAVVIHLTRSSVQSWQELLILGVVLLLRFTTRWSSPILVLISAFLGLVTMFVGWG